ncbi:TonB-dependent receptor domain-containing protein, partial [Porphyromonas loveana]
MSYGTTGNSEMLNYTSGAPEYYAHLPLVGSNPYTDSGLGLSVATPGNPNLSWEQQSQFNVGVSAGFFNGRLTAEVDFYVRATDDMLIEVPLPYLSGFTAQLQNV